MQIRNNFEIKNLTTYKIGGKVKTLYLPETLEELTSILRELDEYVVLGSCSDVLFSSNGYSGNVIITTEMKKFEIRGTKIYAECGVKDPMLAKSVSEVSLSGLEFLIGLPWYNRRRCLYECRCTWPVHCRYACFLLSF